MGNKFILIICFCFFGAAHSQQKRTNFPEIGKPCPDFVFTDVQDYPQERICLNDFKKQWLILDCWNRHCSVCLGRFRATDSLQKKFSKQVRFILVGYTGSQYTHRSDDKPIRALYEKLRERLKIDLAVAYDSVLFHRFDIGACPYMIIVDPAGIVRGITTELNEKNLKELIARKSTTLQKAYNKKGL
jgi:alkyl hydroperoxide reductase subunit AhpC